jgi:hypothetical protein
MKEGYHKRKDGKIVKKGLWYNVNKRKKKKISSLKLNLLLALKHIRLVKKLLFKV